MAVEVLAKAVQAAEEMDLEVAVASEVEVVEPAADR